MSQRFSNQVIGLKCKKMKKIVILFWFCVFSIYCLLEYNTNYAMYLDVLTGKTRRDLHFFRFVLYTGSPQETSFSKVLAKAVLVSNKEDWVLDGTYQVWYDGIIRPKERQNTCPRFAEIHACVTFLTACKAVLPDFDDDKQKAVLSWELNRLKNFDEEWKKWPYPYDCETDGFCQNLDRILASYERYTTKIE